MESVRNYIKVGLITDGAPIIEPMSLNGFDGYHVKNLLIGNGFHWQKDRDVFIPGDLIFLNMKQSDIHMINIVPVEQYLLSVISSEMNPEAPVEFLKAHAVISRSWAMRKVIGTHEDNSSGKLSRPESIIDWEEADEHIGFHVCSDDHCQRYQGLPEIIPDNARQAIASTEGLVLRDSSGRIADARFSKCCGGITEIFSSCWADRDYDYLISQKDPWCDLSSMSEDEKNRFLTMVLKSYDRGTHDFFSWKRIIYGDEISERLKSRFKMDIGLVTSMKILKKGASHRAVKLRLEGEKGNFEIGKELAIRRLLVPDCLYSSWFDIHKVDKAGRPGFLLSGRGWGHGVGLCQIGAANMALNGKSFSEILEFYYPGTTISRY